MATDTTVNIKKCPKCGYTRSPKDDAPSWKCPSCDIVYEKYLKATKKESKAPVGSAKDKTKKPKTRTVLLFVVAGGILLSLLPLFQLIQKKQAISELLEANMLPSDRNLIVHCGSEAFYLKICSLLLKAGVDPNASYEGETALTRLMHTSSLHLKEKDSPSMLDLLLNSGSNPNLENGKGETPLEVLLSTAQIYQNIRDIDVHIENVLPSVQLLLKYGADANSMNDETALCIAASLDSISLSKILLDNGVDINHKNKSDGKTPLICGATNPDIIEYLVNRGANVNGQDHQGISALHNAAENNSDSVRILLKGGADPNISMSQKRIGLTPLHSAALFGQSHSVKTLLEHGANIQASCSEDGETYTASEAALGSFIRVMPMVWYFDIQNKTNEAGAKDLDFSETFRILLDNGGSISNAFVAKERPSGEILNYFRRTKSADVLRSHGIDL